MTPLYFTNAPGISAYISLGNNGLGICKRLELSLQINGKASESYKNVVRLVRPVNQPTKHHGAPRDQ